MNRVNFKQFRFDFKKAMADLEKEHGIAITLGNITYDDLGFRTSLNVVYIDGDVQDQDEVDRAKFERDRQSMFGIESGLFHAEFTQAGQHFRVVGLSPKARKYPIVAEKIGTNSRYKFPRAILSKIHGS